MPRSNSKATAEVRLSSNFFLLQNFPRFVFWNLWIFCLRNETFISCCHFDFDIQARTPSAYLPRTTLHASSEVQFWGICFFSNPYHILSIFCFHFTKRIEVSGKFSIVKEYLVCHICTPCEQHIHANHVKILRLCLPSVSVFEWESLIGNCTCLSFEDI